MAQPSDPNTPPVVPALTAAQWHRLLMVVRQAAYNIGDEIGILYGFQRPCKRCDEAARRGRRADRTDAE